MDIYEVGRGGRIVGRKNVGLGCQWSRIDINIQVPGVLLFHQRKQEFSKYWVAHQDYWILEPDLQLIS